MSLKNVLVTLATLVPMGLLSGPHLCLSAPPAYAGELQANARDHKTIGNSGDQSEAEPRVNLRVLSQNLYIGVDVTNIIEPGTIFNLPGKASAMYKAIQASGYRERLATFAGLIEQQNPDVITLQEVSLFLRQSPSDFYHRSNVNPQYKAEIDYLAILLSELAGRRLHYKAAAISQNAKAEFPVFHQVGPLTSASDLDDIMMIDRDVILVKEELPVKATYQRAYAHVLKSPIRNKAIGKIHRGFQMITTNIAGQDLNVVNTHLEVRTPAPFVNYQYQQAKELAVYLAGLTLPTLVAGDFNDAPNGFRRSPYRVIRSQQFADSWLLVSNQQDETGYTCCHREDLRNQKPTLARRIDYIYFRNFPNTQKLRPIEANLINHVPEHKTSSGLWYSDHAGLVTSFSLAP